MIILFMVFVVQFSVSSACLAINKDQQVRVVGQEKTQDKPSLCKAHN